MRGAVRDLAGRRTHPRSTWRRGEATNTSRGRQGHRAQARNGAARRAPNRQTAHASSTQRRRPESKSPVSLSPAFTLRLLSLSVRALECPGSRRTRRCLRGAVCPSASPALGGNSGAAWVRWLRSYVPFEVRHDDARAMQRAKQTGERTGLCCAFARSRISDVHFQSRATTPHAAGIHSLNLSSLSLGRGHS